MFTFSHMLFGFFAIIITISICYHFKYLLLGLNINWETILLSALVADA